MTYLEALQHKNISVQNADESVLKLYHVLIAPANKDESIEFLEYFLKHSGKCDDETCKKFSSTDDYEIISIRKED